MGLGLIVVSSIVVLLTRIWQVGLLALLLGYIGIGMLSLAAEGPDTAGLRILAGGLVSLVLFLAARRSELGAVQVGARKRNRRWLSSTIMRLAAVGLVALAAYFSTLPDRLPTVPAGLVLAGIWLIGIGLVITLLARHLLWVGMGVPLAVTGFEIVYTNLDQRLIVAGALSATALLAAMLIAVAAALLHPG
jgi:hypothetical protein